MVMTLVIVKVMVADTMFEMDMMITNLLVMVIEAVMYMVIIIAMVLVMMMWMLMAMRLKCSWYV